MFLDPRRPSLTVVCALVAAALATSACSSNVVLRRPPAYDTGYLGPFQRCTRDAECQVDAEYDSSRTNESHTRFFQLPKCAYGIHDLAILDSGSADAVVIVRCAAPDPARGEAGAAETAGSESGLPMATTGSGTRFE